MVLNLLHTAGRRDCGKKKPALRIMGKLAILRSWANLLPKVLHLLVRLSVGLVNVEVDGVFGVVLLSSGIEMV